MSQLVEAVQFMAAVWELSSWHFGQTASDTVSQWPRRLNCGSAAARYLRLWVRIPPDA